MKINGVKAPSLITESAVYGYRNGNCRELARELEDITGWGMASVSYCGWDNDIHRVVESPYGIVDICGVTSLGQLCEYYGLSDGVLFIEPLPDPDYEPPDAYARFRCEVRRVAYAVLLLVAKQIAR